MKANTTNKVPGRTNAPVKTSPVRNMNYGCKKGNFTAGKESPVKFSRAKY